jgi:hypothetical protein
MGGIKAVEDWVSDLLWIIVKRACIASVLTVEADCGSVGAMVDDGGAGAI